MRRRQELFVHLVWSTYNREPQIIDELESWLWSSLAAEGRRLGCPWVVVGALADHVHVLCALPATIAVANLVKQMKGASSRQASEKGQTLRWQGGYGAFSVSTEAVPVVEAYVREQQQRHATQRVQLEWE